MPRQSNSLEWHKKAELDYFSAFIKLWLSFNSLYKRMYQNSNFGRNDRQYIEEIKNSNNILKRKFRNLFDEETSDESKEFKLYLIELIKKFDGGLFGGKTIRSNEYIQPYMNNQRLTEINFRDFIHPRSTQLNRRPTGYVKVGILYIRDNPDEIWPYFVEILYMIRNLLIHGEMEPTDENHQIIKNCYHSLNILIKDEV